MAPQSPHGISRSVFRKAHLCVTLIHITKQNWLGSPVSEGHFSGPPKASDCPHVPLIKDIFNF